MVIFLVLLVGVLGCFQRLGTNAEKGQPQKFYLRAKFKIARELKK
ncbi:MAG: hypothetical protein QXR19_11165 [Candidatus Jordarchaeaceae archaeon]